MLTKADITCVQQGGKGAAVFETGFETVLEAVATLGE
jgi:hypothetical protein